MLPVPATVLTTLLLLVLASSVHGQQAAEQIRLNQLGFYPDAPKAAFVLGGTGDVFHVIGTSRGDTAFTGRLGAPIVAPLSSDTTRRADFSPLRAPGIYALSVPGVGTSHRFEIAPRVHEALALAAARGFYYQRMSVPIEPHYGGRWNWAAGHPDTAVRVHPSAATAQRPAGTLISAPGGWYDAGDYNKYVVNSGITVGTLLSLYEDFPAYAATLHLNIPESGNQVPDLLDETLYNVRWMLAMQDPHDGGVYHKLTNPRFDGYVMPAEATEPRYVVQKSTAAALNFAATMAQASRILRRYERAFPGLADSTVNAATRAWQWARRNPAVLYDQPAMNRQFDPDVVTGAYGDRELWDEFVWAAAELFVTTRQDSFYTAVPLFPNDTAAVPTWNRVETLGYYTLARFRDRLPAHAAADRGRLERILVALADTLIEGADRTAYHTVMGGHPRNYIWGSSAVAANQGIALITAYRLTGDAKYLRHALGNLDYLLGRNATGYSFVTGYGSRTPMHPHHRPSIADAVPEPVPGLLSGGPNVGRQDADDCPVPYPFLEPDRSFLDHYCSYASNEIAINWNAPLVYLAAAMEALQFRAGFSTVAAVLGPLPDQRGSDTIPNLPERHVTRTAQWQAGPQANGPVVFLGNSITEGGDWPALLGDPAVLNRGISGDITYGVLKRLDEVTRHQPSRLFILIGINDIGKGTPSDVIADNYRRIVREVQAASPGTRIYVQSILPVNPQHPRFPRAYDRQDQVLEVNRRLREIAASTGVRFIDLAPAVTDAQGRLAEQYTYDGLHLNEAGYRAWADLLRREGHF
jgi:endoglucanase